MEETKNLSFQERIQELRRSLGNLPGAFAMVWEADRSSTARLALFTGLAALLPLSQAYTGKLIVDGVVRSISLALGVEASFRIIWPFLAAEFFLFAAGSLLSHARRLTEQVLDQKAGHAITEKIIRKALGLELTYFEDSQFYDRMQNARRESEYRALAIINGSFQLAQNVITLISFIFILFAMNPFIAIILFSAAIPSFAVQTRYSKMKFRLQSWRAPESRMMTYLEHLLTLDSTVKEVKLFGLGNELLSRFNSLFDRIFAEDLGLARRRLRFSYLWGLFSTVSFYVCYAWIIFLTVTREITLGDMTLYLGAVRMSQGSFQGLLDNIARLYENGLFMENLFSFLSIRPRERITIDSPPPEFPPGSGIEFSGVSYRYPSSSSYAVSDFSLSIRPGEKIAVVGENGSGKTTLIKLLTRLYEPASGRITIDGQDLQRMDAGEIHRRIGVIFQDYVRYQLTLRENIGFGSIENLEDTDRVLSALKNSGSEDLLTSLPDGLESMLGHQFLKGRELSVGQWQKIALGRAFMRLSDILILDEPTSSMDANREYEIFRRFQALTEGKTVILISHRFSTVRMADRIGVMQKGCLVELGSHEELIEKDGVYRKMFELQAQGYR